MSSGVNAQIEEMANAWTRCQGQWWDSMFGISSGQFGLPWENVFSRQLEMSEDTVNCVLQQQSDCIHMVLKNSRPGDGAPKVASEWSEQLENAVQHWIDAQQQAWSSWFRAVKQMDPYRAHGHSKRKPASHADKVFEAWQEATQTTLRAQADWMSSVAPAGGHASEQVAQAAKSAGNGAQRLGTQSAKKANSGATASKGADSRRTA
ncbi:MAG: hypothetical protein H0V34_07405 [Gammaproteobacteria bacterium]|nr:hypothetical protein [Gammaproteobacteria bacterium]